jgi:hypothetical protein
MATLLNYAPSTVLCSGKHKSQSSPGYLGSIGFGFKYTHVYLHKAQFSRKTATYYLFTWQGYRAKMEKTVLEKPCHHQKLHPWSPPGSLTAFGELKLVNHLPLWKLSILLLLFFTFFKASEGDWRDGLVVESTGHASRGPEFYYGSAQLSCSSSSTGLKIALLLAFVGTSYSGGTKTCM